MFFPLSDGLEANIIVPTPSLTGLCFGLGMYDLDIVNLPNLWRLS